VKFWSSMEVFHPAYAAAKSVDRAVLHYLTEAIGKSILRDLDGEIAFIPVIMPVEMHKRYKEIIRYRKKDNHIELRPHLNYELFVGDDRTSQLTNYIGGIERGLALMPKLGASPEQIEALREILCDATSKIAVADFPSGKPH
jgi:hypothetical protein